MMQERLVKKFEGQNWTRNIPLPYACGGYRNDE